MKELREQTTPLKIKIDCMIDDDWILQICWRSKPQLWRSKSTYDSTTGGKPSYLGERSSEDKCACDGEQIQGNQNHMQQTWAIFKAWMLCTARNPATTRNWKRGHQRDRYQIGELLDVEIDEDDISVSHCLHTSARCKGKWRLPAIIDKFVRQAIKVSLYSAREKLKEFINNHIGYSEVNKIYINEKTWRKSIRCSLRIAWRHRGSWATITFG